MQKFKFSLLAATVIAGVVASPVSAQTLTTILAPGLPQTTVTNGAGATFTYDGDNAIHGAGSTAVQNVLVRVFNCLGTPAQLGNGQPGQSAAAGTQSKVAPGAFAGAIPMTCNNTSSNVNYTGGSSTYEIQPQSAAVAANVANIATGTEVGFAGKYVGTGSGFGRKIWYWFGDVFDGGNNANAVAHVTNTFNTVGTDNRWSHVQYAFSDAPIAQSDLATYDTAGNAKTYAGPAIQFPLFILPVAIAYDTEYGINKAGHAMTLNVQNNSVFGSLTIASLHLNPQTYCGIFNGDITNWNDPQLKALNKKVALFDPVNDTATRWATDGAPIRLVGRLDNSGTTDVFTRHLAAVCSTAAYVPVNATAGANKYLHNAESLPWDNTQNGGVDYSLVRSDSNYKAANNGGSKVAGTTNMVSGDWFNGTAIVNQQVNGAATLSAAPNGNKGSGLFTVTNGGGNVQKLLVLAPDYSLNGVLLNGKIGYISADFVQPSVDSKGGIVGATLQNSAGAFVAPTIANGIKAFGTILPPETTDTTGAYHAGSDTRTVNLEGSGTGVATRTNPIAWTDVLYVTNSAQTTLATPAAGYPITGTTQFFGYTCYANQGNLEAVANLLGTLVGAVKKDSTGAAITPTTFSLSSATTPGIIDQSNIGIVPAAWQKAIANTFLSSTSDVSTALGTSPLYIASGLVSTSKTVKAVKATKTTPAVPAYTVVTRPAANPTCAANSYVGA